MNRRQFVAALPAIPALAAKPRRMMYSDASRVGRPLAKDPSAIRLGGRYLLYYSLPAHGDQRPGDGWAIGIATSKNLVDWEKAGEMLPSSGVETKGICAPGAIVLDGKVHLFYQTYGNGRNDAICHAVSTDGIRFERDPSNPVFHPTGNWNCGRAIDADVIVHQGGLLMLCATRDPDFKIQMLVAARAPLGSGFGRASWKQLADFSVLKPELPWEKKCIEAPALAFHGGRLYAFYAGGYNNEPQQIGCASSADGVHWTRLKDKPLLPNGAPGEWNSSESGHPGVLTDRGRHYLFFQGNNDNGRTWHLSCRRIRWTARGPVIDPA